MTKTFKIYGADGHRQAASFGKSFLWDFSEDGRKRIILCQNADMTNTNAYSLLTIVRNTEKECYEELKGQLSDGIFENCKTGRIIEISFDFTGGENDVF